MAEQSFDEFFKRATGSENSPYPFQREFAKAKDLYQLVDVPTGLGKTAMVVLGWLWRRFHADDAIRKATPRRLVYCLPMRVLVEQTTENARKWVANLCEAGRLPKDVPVHVLMGGEEQTDWAIWPEREMILTGTQDMLLSRALNRGYAASRARWPMEFGLLHNDCLWVFDEVQLMGNGLATTVQLDAFAKKLWKPARQSRFLWMSATIGDSFLQTRDRRDWNLTDATRLGLSQRDFDNLGVQKRLQAPKTLHIVKDLPKPAKILEAHPRGRISLLILNTVPVARGVYEELRQELAKPAARNKPKGPRPEVCLLHSRFRPMDRERHMETVLRFIDKMGEPGAVPDSDGLIIVSTQVVEAGFDGSGARLWSEIAPWPSAIQRLGRLNREGAQANASAAFWMPRADDTNKGDNSPNARRVGPYEKKALDATKRMLEAVIAKQASGLAYREALDTVLATTSSQETMRIEPEVVVRPDDFFELFSTEPDLAGGFTNVSRFVRDQDRNVDVHVFWRDFDPAKLKQPREPAPAREELCSVPFFEFRQFVGKTRMPWEWNFEMGRWESRRAADIQPGMTLLLPKTAGGYDHHVGWTGDANDRNFDVLLGSDDGDSLDADFLSGSQEWVSLSDHLRDVESVLADILRALELQETPIGKALMMAARWHDRGKAIGRWQDRVKDHTVKVCERLKQVTKAAAIPRLDEVVAKWQERLRSKDGVVELWGKFPDARAASLDGRLNLSDPERAKLSRKLKVVFRPGLRHEAASALAVWESWLARSDGLTALAVYLTACHHGKVRTVLRSRSDGDDVFGVIDEMTLPPVLGFFANPTQLRTDPKYVGACGEWDETNETFTITSPSWLQMVAELVGSKYEGQPATAEVIPENEPRDLGPLTLAYLEALLRAADIRASRERAKGGKS